MNIRSRVLTCTFLAAFLAILPAQSRAAGDHAHHAALFAGATTADSHTDFTLGADYEYRLDPMFGAGALYEHIFSGTVKKDIVAVSAYIHPMDALKFNVSPGIEFSEGHNAFLARFGAGYDIDCSGFTITPIFAYDWIEGGHSAIVYGAAFGIGF